MHKVTGNQPEPVKQRIYGSQKVEPIEDAPSDQPRVLPNTRVHGQRSCPTIHVRSLDNDAEMVINENDFDPDRHERLDELKIAKE